MYNDGPGGFRVASQSHHHRLLMISLSLILRTSPSRVESGAETGLDSLIARGARYQRALYGVTSQDGHWSKGLGFGLLLEVGESLH
jgi:uncharacterized protein